MLIRKLNCLRTYVIMTQYINGVKASFSVNIIDYHHNWLCYTEIKAQPLTIVIIISLYAMQFINKMD